MNNQYEKPPPLIDEINYPFWKAAKKHELILQKCQVCGHHCYPPSLTCPFCLSDKLKWVKVSGKGKVYTWTVFHKLYHQAFSKDIPYVVAVVELEEGPRMITNIVECSLDDIRIDMPIEVVFEDVTEEISLPQFRPASR